MGSRHLLQSGSGSQLPLILAKTPCACLPAAAADAQRDATKPSAKDTSKARLAQLSGSGQSAKKQQQNKQQLALPSGGGYVYSLNGVTAVLTSESPVNMIQLVKMFEDHYAGFLHLSEVR